MPSVITRLTERQNEAYEFIRAYIREHRKPPTLQEIGAALGIRSSNGVFKLLQALEAKGYITREPHTARGLRLKGPADALDGDDGLPSLPLVSRTASDQPDRLRHRPRLHLSIDPFFLRGVDPDACVIAPAGDDGMNPAGIRKGDYLLIEEAAWESLHNGETAAVLVREALKARQFVHVNGKHHLRPADRTYTEEAFSPADPACYVIGRIIGLIRRL